MYCYRTWEKRSGTFSSPGAFMFLWMCFPRCPVHLCRLWIALRSSENELAVGFTVWVLAQWNDSPATRSSAGGNRLPKGSQLEFPAGGTLSHYGAMRLLAENLHYLFQIPTVSALLWLLRWFHSSFSKELQGRPIWIRLLSRTVIGLPWPQPCAAWSEGSPHSFPNTWTWASLYSSVFSLDSMKPSYIKHKLSSSIQTHMD